MIKDRNIAHDAMISAHKLNLSLNPGNETFYVGTDGTGAFDLAKTRLPGDRLFTTFNSAIAACAASRGDNIIALPNHAESIGDTSSSGAIDFDVAGINVLGIGTGAAMPKITFAHADADCIIGADDIKLQGLNLFAAITGVKLGIAVETTVTGTIIAKNKFSVEETTVDEFLIPINLTVGCDNTLIIGNQIDMGLGGATDGIALVGASAGIQIMDNMIMGDYSLGNLTAITTLSSDLAIEGNLLINGNANALNDQPVIEFITGCLGYVRDNDFLTNVATNLVSQTVADTMLFSNNRYNNDVGPGQTSTLTSTSIVAAIDE